MAGVGSRSSRVPDFQCMFCCEKVKSCMCFGGELGERLSLVLRAPSVAAEEECYKELFIIAITLLRVHSVLGSWKRWSFGMFSAL